MQRSSDCSKSDLGRHCLFGFSPSIQGISGNAYNRQYPDGIDLKSASLAFNGALFYMYTTLARNRKLQHEKFYTEYGWMDG